MRGTALVYSSHNRSNYIHDRFIAQRALHGWADRRVLFLPMSETPQNGSELERQESHCSTFDWFLGWNDLGLEVYSANTGGCRDALHVDRVNGNQGAESTLAFLLSVTEMQITQNAVAVFNQPVA